MPEKPHFENSEAQKEMLRQEITRMAQELSEQGEAFPFLGLDAEQYKAMKQTDEQYPGFSTPTDEIIELLKNDGMKVVVSPEHPDSGNVFIIPTTTDNFDFSLPLSSLDVAPTLDPRIADLILKIKTYKV